MGDLAEMVGIQWRLTYLNVPFGGNLCDESFCDFMLQKILRRLDSGEGSYFLLGGQLTLTHASLSDVPMYYLSLSKVSVAVANRIERVMRDFLWPRDGESKRDSLVSWEVCYNSKEDRGLGVCNLVSKSISIMARWY